MGTATKIVAAIVLFILLGLGITFLSGGLTILMAPFQGQVEKSQKVEGSGDYVVAQHDYFYNLCSDIQTKQDNIKTLEAAGEKDAVTANQLELNRLVNKYNADAANNYTKGQFREDELPYHIDANRKVQTCGTP